MMPFSVLVSADDKGAGIAVSSGDGPGLCSGVCHHQAVGSMGGGGAGGLFPPAAGDAGEKRRVSNEDEQV